MMLFFTDPVRITEEGIRIRLFPFFPKIIPYAEVKSIRRAGLGEILKASLNRSGPKILHYAKVPLYGVLIETGQNRYIAVNPRRPDEFVASVSSRISISN